MKNKGIKKYTIALLVCFFALLTCVNAETVDNKKYLTYTQEIPVGGTEFSGFKCELVNSSDNEYVSIRNDDGMYSHITYKKIVPNSGSIIPIRCSWSNVNKMGASGPGSILYNFNLENDPTINHNNGSTVVSSFTVQIWSEPGYDQNTNIYKYISGGSITGYTWESGSEYVDIVGTCSGTTCNIKPSDEVNKMVGAHSLQSVMKIKFTMGGETYEVTANIIINTTSSTKIFPGEYGVCQLGSNWEADTYKLKTFYKSTTPNVTLPSCDSSKTSSPVIFKGWTKTTGGQLNNATSNNCYNVAPAGATAENNATYVACYESLPQVIISFSKGTLTDTTGWKQVGTSTNTYFAVGEGNVTLPTIEVEGFLGWRKNNINGQFFKAGESVPYDGSRYYAEIENKRYYQDTNKAVRQNGTTSLVVQGMTGCSSTSESIIVNYVQGECQVSGVNQSEGGSRSDVVVTLDNGQTLTYSFMVIPQLDEKDTSEFLIDTAKNIHFGDNYFGENGDNQTGGGGTGGNAESLSDNFCKELKIHYQGGSTTSTTSFGGGGYNRRINSSLYEVQDTCNGNNKYTYVAFCLDPGRHGPDKKGVWRTYIVNDQDLSKSTGRIKKLLTYILSIRDDINTIAADIDNADRIGIHHALRFAAQIDGIDSGGKDFPLRYKYYKNTSTKINACGDNASCIETAIKNNFIDSSNGYTVNDGLRPQIMKIMVDYLANSYNTEVEDTGIEQSLANPETSREGNAAVYKVDIKFTLPKTAENITFEPEATCNGSNKFGISCDAPQLVSQETGEGGKLVYTYTVMMRKTGNAGLPTTEKDKKLVSFKLKYDGAGINNIMLATDQAEPQNYQRMLVFKRTEAAIDVYIPFKLDCNSYDLSTYDPNNPSSFPTEEFLAAGCCAFLTDTVENQEFLEKECSQECTTSTLASVCSFTPTAGKVDLYTIKEGHKGGDPQIGKCVVNVSERYQNNSYNNFVRYDDNGNLYNVKDELNVEGEKNKFCTVTCREEWTIAMEAFGNYVGKRAIAAGTYFKVQTDEMYLGGKRECYTNYLDYKYFTEFMGEKSDEVVKAYDEYSLWSHRYHDIMKQINNEETRLPSRTGTGSGCIKRGYCPSGYSQDGCGSCIEDNPPSTCGKDHDEQCPPKHAAMPCEETGQVNNHKVDLGKYIDSGDRDLNYTTKKEKTTDNNDNTETTKTLMGDGNSKMVDVYFTSKEFTCSGNWACNEGETASDPTCTGTSYGFKNFCASNASANGEYCVPGDPGDPESAFDPISDAMQQEYNSQASSAKQTLIQKNKEVYKFAEMFYKCQHFEVTNKYSGNKEEYAGWAENTPHKIDDYIMGYETDYAQIENRYQPGATYEYDDEAYMTLLGEDNYIVPYIEKNDSVMSGYTSTTNERTEAELHNVNNGGTSTTEKVYLSRNYLETTYYHSLDPWQKDSDEAKTYDNNTGSLYAKGETKNAPYKEGIITLCKVSPGENSPEFPSDSEDYALTDKLDPFKDISDNEWMSGSCFKVKMYYRDINYVKTSIDNSSFFKNKGDWFFSNSSGMYVAHGDDVDDALSNLKSKAHSAAGTQIPTDKENWYAPSLVNVFPVSFSAPRNLYTYTYEFGDMGYFTETKKLGRIMGGEKAIIEENKRTCFYEIYEEVCLCCGSEDYNYTTKYETVRDGMASQMGYDVSDSNAVKNNKKGTLAITPSTVQLADLNSDSNRELASNWSDSSPFYYDGILYDTDKGSKVLKAIEARGETIYDDPSSNNSGLEYSYILTPSTIAQIREYNDTYGYEVTYNRVHIYGRYKTGEENTKLDLDAAGEISFVHYGSLFLESFLPGNAVIEHLASRTGDDNVCYVRDSDLSNKPEEVLRKKIKEDGCRWVDYVVSSPTEYIESNVDNKLNPPSALRMALK